MTILRVAVEYPSCLFPDSLDIRALELIVHRMLKIIRTGEKVELLDSQSGALSLELQITTNVKIEERGLLLLVGLAEKVDAYLYGRTGVLPNSDKRVFGQILWRETQNAIDVELPSRIFCS